MYYIDEDLRNIYNEESDKINNYIKNNLSCNEKIEVNISDLKIGDIVYVNFISDSQKYIYDLYPKFGVISSIDNDNILILNIDKKSENLLHDNVSYYGSSLGYSYYIYKFI